MHMHHSFYISSGAKNAMHTLRHSRACEGGYFDGYVCNLAVDVEKAQAKARDYFERVEHAFIGDHSSVTFSDDPDCVLFERTGRLSVAQTEWLRWIENGLFPFGKHKGAAIRSAPDGYILYFADKHNDADIVTAALATACMGVALDRGLIAKRDAARAEREARDARSNHVGTVGERVAIDGAIEVAVCINKDVIDFTPARYLTKVRQGDDVVSYFGPRPLGEPGQRIRFMARVKRHGDYKGVKSTTVQRPTKIEVLELDTPA